MGVLVVAPESDLHARAVAQRLTAMGHSVVIWDTSWFPFKQELTWSPDGSVRLKMSHNDYELAPFGVVWWRRFHPPIVDPAITDPIVKRFCYSEAAALLRGVFRTTFTQVINNPDDDARAGIKPLQLKMAADCGICIPKTVVSNSQTEIVAFIQEHQHVICKPLVCNFLHTVPTRISQVGEFNSQADVAAAPVIVQSLVEAARDIRVTVIGQDLFAAELARDDINSIVDWRVLPTQSWRPHRLPTDISARILKFMSLLRLDMGSLDLRLSPSGEYVFLEVNPSGQFLFLEIEAGLPVSQAVADYLVKRISTPDDPKSHAALNR